MATKIRGLGRLLIALTLMGWGQLHSLRTLHIGVLLSLLAFSAASTAATSLTYYYGKQGDWVTSRQKSSDAACRAILSESPEAAQYKHVSALQGGGGGACIGDLPTGNRGTYGFWSMATIECEHGSTDGLNCVVPQEPQDCSAVSPGIFKSPSAPVVDIAGRKYVASGFGAETACYETCSYTISSFSQSCYFESGSTNTGFCNYIGTANGENCSAPNNDLGRPGDQLNPPGTPNVPPSDPNDPGCPPGGYTWTTAGCIKTPGGNNGSNPGDGGDTGGGNTGGGDNGGNNGGGDGNNGGGNNSGGNNGGGTGNGDGNGNGNGDGNTGGGGPPTDVSGVESRLDKIWDSLFGGEYDGSADGDDGDTEEAGADAGSALAELFSTKGQETLDEHEEKSQEFLDGLPDTVEGWFGDGGAVGLRQGLETVLPAASGCSDYRINFSLDKYSSVLVLPVCEISRYVRLLEWVIYCVTAIGLWKILFSGLRQDDVKASKGGF